MEIATAMEIIGDNNALSEQMCVACIRVESRIRFFFFAGLRPWLPIGTRQ